jgi:hypothetical protein
VALDGSGKGSYAVDLTTDTTGPSDVSTLIKRAIPYVVTPKLAPPESGTVTAQVSVVPLEVDSPGAQTVLEGPSLEIHGRASKGATVTMNGAALTTSADGFFQQTLDTSKLGDVPVDVSAVAAPFAPRTVHLAVKRVSSLADEAKARDAQGSLGYDAVVVQLPTPDVVADAGLPSKTLDQPLPMIVEGEVIEANPRGLRTLLLVNDQRGCAKAPCVTRVALTHVEKLGGGDYVRAYGRVLRATLVNGKTIPDVEADFLVRGRR